MSVMGCLLLLAAAIGHAAWLIFHVNWWYGLPVSRRFLRALQDATLPAIPAGPLVAGWFYRSDLLGLARFSSQHWGQSLLAAYVIACASLGVTIVPWVTLRRLWRRPAPALITNHTRTIDFAQRLGHRPAGRGRYWPLARLPGNEIFTVDFAERLLRLPRLPSAWDGLTILHLSDLHFHGSPERVFFERVMDECRDWKPDIVCLTGDIVDTMRHHRWVLPVLGRLQWNIAAFAILGNHDHWHEPPLVVRRLERLGFHVLRNRWTTLEVRGEPLIVIGHEGPWLRPAPDLTPCPSAGFRLCLSHTPDNVRWAQRHGIDLMLAGHNHGGQIRFPIIGSVFVPSRYSRRYDCGTFAEAPTLIHVSRGLSGKQPVRYGCRPEAVKLVLRAPQDHVSR